MSYNSSETTTRATLSVAAKASSPKNHHASNPPTRLRILVQNFVLIWLDSNIEDTKSDFQNYIAQLRAIINSIDTFTNTDKCVDYLRKIKNEKAFLIVSEDLGQHIVPLIHDWPQVHFIYVFCGNKSKDKQWVKDWYKVNGVCTQIQHICNALKRHTRQCDQDSASISIVSSELDQSSMYSQLLKEILLEMDFDEDAKKKLVYFCREIFKDNQHELKIIDEFEQNYHHESAIWWYTRECFTYHMLNRALRMLEVETVIKMGFFLRDLHRQIEKLHANISLDSIVAFTVYRGQGILNSEFEKMRKKQGSLLSFNSFLSTSTDQQVSFCYAESASENPDLTGILFCIQIDPALAPVPFASLKNISYFTAEEEILFSMHTVFRIGDIKQIKDRVWQVHLTLTSDNDEQLRILTEFMRDEIRREPEFGWPRLGKLMIRIGELDKAEEFYQMLLESTGENNEKKLADMYRELGWIKYWKLDYTGAVDLFQKSLEIHQKFLHPSHHYLATIHGDIGSLYSKMGEYSTALDFYQRSLDMYQKSILPSHPDLAHIYNSIGLVHKAMGEYSTAFEFYQKTLEIQQKSQPPNHGLIATSYNNMGQVHDDMGEYSIALGFYQTRLKILKKCVPPYHPLLTATYDDIGEMHRKMGEYSAALDFYQKTLEIQQKFLPSNHPDLATTYSNIGRVHENIGEHLTALDFYQKALEVQQKHLHSNHPSLATTYSNIGGVHSSMGEYSTALDFYQRTLEIQRKSLPPNHPQLATIYNTVGLVHKAMGKNSTAFEFYRKTLEIDQKYLSSNHPTIAAIYNNIAQAYDEMGEYLSAIDFYQKTLEILKKSLLPKHPLMAITYHNMARVFEGLKRYDKNR